MKNFIKPIGLFLIIITFILHPNKKDKTTPQMGLPMEMKF